MGVRELIESAIARRSIVLRHATFRPARHSKAATSARPGREAGRRSARPHTGGEATHETAGRQPIDAARRSSEHGHARWITLCGVLGVRSSASAWALLIYCNGYAIADALHEDPAAAVDPHLAVSADVFRRAVLLACSSAITMALSRLGRLVRHVRRRRHGERRALAGQAQASVVAGLNDKYVVDGAVNGVATLAQDLGAAVRAPQTGRIRMYVTVLMVAVALGLAGAIIVVLSSEQ